MPSTANIKFNVIDESFVPEDPSKGISGFMGVFKRGPIGKANEIFTSWTRFKRVYGGLMAGNDDPLIAKRALENGTKLRICGVRHFTDITNPNSFDGVLATNFATKVLTLSGAMTNVNTAVYTINAVAVSQAFSVSSDNTLKLLAAKVQAAYPALIAAWYVTTNKLQMTQLSGTGVLTVTGAGGITVAATTLTGFRETGGTELFTISPKYIGIDYNNMMVSVMAPSNGISGYFDLKIEFPTESDYTPELYTNLTIPGNPTIAASNYLKDVVMNSGVVDVAYKDLSALAAPITPLINYSAYSGGTNGGTVTDTDFIGDSAGKNGLHAYDGIGDILALGASNTSDALAIAGAAYAHSRKDLQYFHHFSNALTTASAITAAKAALNIDTPYIEFWTGGVEALDPLTNTWKKLNGIGDILGRAASSEVNYGPWFSFAGVNRGLIQNAIGVVNNFYGANSVTNPELTDLEALANRQINAIINADGQIYLSGNFSGQLALSKMSFNNAVRLVIYIKKLLKPILQRYIEEPNDIPTWKDIFLDVTVQMDPLKTSKRAINDYTWQGDQYATSMDDLEINNPTDVGLGKYKAKLLLDAIVSLQQIAIDIVMLPTGVTFEDSQLGTEI